MDKEGFFRGQSLNRREMIKAIGGAAAVMVSSKTESATAEKRESPTKIESLPIRSYTYESSLTNEELEAQKTKAINSLIGGFWDRPLEHEHNMRRYFPACKSREDVFNDLKKRSTMRLSSPAENKKLVEKNRDEMDELAGQIQDGRYGLFVHGNTNTLYLLQRKRAVIQFVKAYSISASGRKWSNVKDSGGTPPGLHGIAEHVQGQLGEILSGDKHAKDAEQVEGKYYVKGLDEKGADQIPAVMTGQFMMVSSAAAKKSPNTTTRRGFRGHGTNWPSGLGERGTSGGCIRMSNESIRDLGNYIDVGKLVGENMVIGGTPVMIHMTPTEIWNSDTVDVKEQQTVEHSGTPLNSSEKDDMYDLDFGQNEKTQAKVRARPQAKQKDTDTYDLDFGSAH